MTQEDKELLLKDLCARLPYGVKYMRYSWNYDTDQELPIIETLECVDKDGYINHRRVYTVERIKPYLFPLSSMTVEQMCKVQNLLPNNCDISFQNQKITFYDEGNIQLKQLEKIFKFFHLYHLDYRGLIEKGLAIDATGKNIY